MKVFSVVAGVAAMAAAIGRFLLGRGEIDAVLGLLGSAPQAALVGIVWQALTYVMAVFGAALIVSARASRETAQSVALLSTAIFGGIAAIMAVYAGAALADPFAFFPFYIMATVAVLSGVAAARA